MSDERVIGTHLGQVKWFDNKLGYGFITVVSEEHKGDDIFVHQTNVHPLQSEYRTLLKGEYVSLNISDDSKRQAVDVTGVLGGSLRCDEPRPVSRGRNRGRGGHRGDLEEHETQEQETESTQE
jgi:cold shock CspA family protein